MPTDIIPAVTAFAAFFLIFMAALGYGVVATNMAERKESAKP